MRVPVRMPIQQVEVGPFVGPRRAVATVEAERVLEVGRRARLFAYGGDVRAEDPLSLVYHGNLGDDVDPAIDTTMTLEYPAPAPLTFQDVSPALIEVQQAQFPTYGVPALPSDAIAQVDSSGRTVGWYRTNADGSTTLWSAAGVPTGTTLPSAPSPVSIGEAEWWQRLPAITGSAAVLAQTIARIVNPSAPAAAGVTQYTIPATATQPAQRVVYDPRTGRITTTPLGVAAPSGSMLPSFLQVAPGAAWYQNPMLLLGGGLVAMILLVAVSRR